MAAIVILTERACNKRRSSQAWVLFSSVLLPSSTYRLALQQLALAAYCKAKLNDPGVQRSRVYIRALSFVPGRGKSFETLEGPAPKPAVRRKRWRTSGKRPEHREIASAPFSSGLL